jgi:hypothetical protein
MTPVLQAVADAVANAVAAGSSKAEIRAACIIKKTPKNTIHSEARYRYTVLVKSGIAPEVAERNIIKQCYGGFVSGQTARVFSGKAGAPINKPAFERTRIMTDQDIAREAKSILSR